MTVIDGGNTIGRAIGAHVVCPFWRILILGTLM
jgi:hypothetical protein